MRPAAKFEVLGAVPGTTKANMQAQNHSNQPTSAHIVLLIDTGLPKSDLVAPVTPPPGLHASLSGITLGVPVIVDGKTIVRRSDRIGEASFAIRTERCSFLVDPKGVAGPEPGGAVLERNFLCEADRGVPAVYPYAVRACCVCADDGM